jgi:hypothetical protein
MAPKKDDDPIAKLTKTIEDILDKRDQRTKEASDPKARFDRVMDRLEQFLDGADKPPESKPKPEGKKGGVITALFGEEEAS